AWVLTLDSVMRKINRKLQRFLVGLTRIISKLLQLSVGKLVLKSSWMRVSTGLEWSGQQVQSANLKRTPQGPWAEVVKACNAWVGKTASELITCCLMRQDIGWAFLVNLVVIRDGLITIITLSPYDTDQDALSDRGNGILG
ncbi:hypothetical protein Taro_043128, partial [Colocasia esculenta]|nr:hypothetical protein [Colocasia esculenta]